MTKLRGSGREVPIENVFANAWNPNKQDPWTFDKQKHSLEQFALSAPIIVREVRSKRASSVTAGEAAGAGEAGVEQAGEVRYEIIDGEHRWRAAQELGWEHVSVWNLGEVSEAESKQLTIIFNELSGRPDADDLALLLQSIEEQIGREELVANMPFTDVQIDDLINTIEFDWSNFEAAEEEDEDGEKMSLVRMEFRMDEKDAQVVHRALAQAGVREKFDHTSQAGQVQALLCLANLYLGSDTAS